MKLLPKNLALFHSNKCPFTESFEQKSPRLSLPCLPITTLFRLLALIQGGEDFVGDIFDALRVNDGLASGFARLALRIRFTPEASPIDRVAATTSSMTRLF